MVMNYGDIYRSIEEKVPSQDWSTPQWHAVAEEDTLILYREDWKQGEDLEAFFYSRGQGEDPEQNSILLEMHVRGDQGNRDETMEELEDRIQEELKPLIGWEIIKQDDLFARKELPSDPLTLQPRLLEEFKKLQPIVRQVDKVLRYRQDHQDGEVSGESGKESGKTDS